MPKISVKIRESKEEIKNLSDSISVWEEYKDTSFYEKNNKVSYKGRCYVCINNGIGISPENAKEAKRENRAFRVYRECKAFGAKKEIRAIKAIKVKRATKD